MSGPETAIFTPGLHIRGIAADAAMLTPLAFVFGLSARVNRMQPATARLVFLAFAAFYNVGAVGLAWAGLMSPLLCAVLMPLSSLTSIALVLRSLGRKEAPWKSSFSKSS